MKNYQSDFQPQFYLALTLEKEEDEKRAAEYKETVSSDAGIYLPDIPDDELPFK